MKEQLSFEEKAKRYDEAIRESSKIIDYCASGANIPECISVKATIEQIFPELKESEDEKIRKELLQIAEESEDSFYMVMTPNKREKLIAWLEKQGEKKPTDKVEPKFKKGDWVILMVKRCISLM